VTALT
jgi:capping protein beta